MINEKLKQIAIERLKEADLLDTELGHIKADEILCDLLKSLGYEDVVVEFNKIGKWYA
jgi:hypothetical protein